MSTMSTNNHIDASDQPVNCYIGCVCEEHFLGSCGGTPIQPHPIPIWSPNFSPRNHGSQQQVVSTAQNTGPRYIDATFSVAPDAPHDIFGTTSFEDQHSQEVHAGFAHRTGIDNEFFGFEQNYPIVGFGSNVGQYSLEQDFNTPFGATSHTSNGNDLLISGENFNSNVNQGSNPYESVLLGEQNAIEGPLFDPASSITRDFDIEFQVTHSIRASNNAVVNPGDHQYRCNLCHRAFKRDADCIRHENSVHSRRPGIYLCPIAGCAKSQGRGLSRADKVTEHLWRKHGNLGYTKRTSRV